MGTVWIKTEPTNGDPSTYFQIKCEEEINITDTIPYTDSVCFTVQELDPESVNVKQEPLEFRTDDHGTIPSNNKVKFEMHLEHFPYVQSLDPITAFGSTAER